MKIAQKRKLIRLSILAILLIAATAISARFALHRSAQDRVLSVDRSPKVRVALVLGTLALPSHVPSPKLASRCQKAVELYKSRKVDKLLMSGDGREKSGNECETMRRYAIAHGVPSEAIVLDPVGFRTYDSIYRAKHIFGLSKMIVVTQGYHLDRSLLYCRKIGVDAYGVPAALPASVRDNLREPLASIGALVDVYIRQPSPVMGKVQKI